MKLNPSFTGIPPTLTNHFPGGAWRLLSRSAAGLAPLLAAALLTGISHAQQQDPLVIKDGNATFSGNVGISTDAPPSAKLELVATFPESYLLKLRNAFPTWGDPGHFNQYRFIITDSATTGQPYPDTFKQFQVGAGGVAIGGNHDNPLLPPSYLSPDALYVMGNVGVSAGNLTVNGNVGIGTTSPVGKLNVQADGKGDWAGDDGIGQVIISGATAPENCLGLMIDTGKQVGKIQAELRGFRALPLALNPMGGNVGIGTDNPTKAKLEIDGNVQSNNGESIYFTRQAARALDYDPDGKINTNVSIYASDVISAASFAAFSDERIKSIAGLSDGAKDLQTLLGLRVTDYTYKDTVAKGSAPQKKLIAQQVEQVYPQAVTRGVDVVPDIYQQAPIAEGWITLPTTLRKNERVRLIAGEREGIYDVVEVDPDGGRFRTVFQPTGHVVFVYGREVKDFRSLDYDAIAMLNVSATQQIKKEKDAEVGALQQENRALRARLEILETRDKLRDERLSKLEHALDALAAARAPQPPGRTVSLK